MEAPSLALPWEEEEASEESRVSDGLAENSVVVVAEETTVMRGNAELDVGNAVISAEVVVLDEDIGITRCWVNLATPIKLSLSHVLLGAEDGKNCDPHAVVDTADSLEAIKDTSLDEAPKVTLLASQEHGKPSGEQQ